MEWLTPKLIEGFILLAKEGGLALALFIVLVFLGIEIKRGKEKDKIIAAERKSKDEIQTKTLTLIGEVKTVISNSNLLLEMLTRGRK